MVKLYRDLINEQSETDQITVGNVVAEDRRPLWLLTFIDLISLLLAFFHYDFFNVYNKDECLGYLSGSLDNEKIEVSSIEIMKIVHH